MRNNPKEYYHSSITELRGIYRGVIEENNDPEKLGRCKVRIFGIHTPNKKKTNDDGIPTEELPWAEPAMGLFEGSVTGFGSWTVPLQGSHVFLFFEGGHILKPRFFATSPGLPTDQNHGFRDDQGFSDPDKKYPNETSKSPHKPNGLDESDFHRLARGETSNTIVESKNSKRKKGVNSPGGNWDEPTSPYNATYPKNKVFSTNSGITIELDDTQDSRRILIYHPSNSYIEIDNNGNMVIKNAKRKYEIVDTDKKEVVGRNKHETIENNKYIKIEGDCNVEIDGNYDMDIGGNFNVTAGGNFNFNGSTFNWNQ